MNTGIIKFFNREKGYGFIRYNQTDEIFVHATSLTQPVKMDDKVSFDIANTERGLSAIDVKLL